MVLVSNYICKEGYIDITLPNSPEAPEHIGKFQVLLLSSVYAIHAPAGTVGQENSQALPISTERIGPWRSARLPLPQEGRTDPN